MTTSLARCPGPCLRLRSGQVWSARNLEGRRVTCLSGRLWLTQEGDGRDFLLAPGQSVRVEGPGLVAVQAFEDSRFRVEGRP